MIHEKNINQLKSEVQYIQEVGTPSSCEMAYVISLNLTFWVSFLLCVLIISPFFLLLSKLPSDICQVSNIISDPPISQQTLTKHHEPSTGPTHPS